MSIRWVVGLLLIISVGCSKGRKTPPPPTVRERLAQEVEQERQTSTDAVDAYNPKVQGLIDELGAPAVDILRQLPAVADVEVLVKTPKASHRIIHLRDRHTVPKQLLAADISETLNRPLSDLDIDEIFGRFILQVELVQVQEIALLRCLIKHHGLKRVLKQGLTPRSVPVYREILVTSRNMDEQLAEVRDKDPSADAMATELHRRLLEYGTAFQLEMNRELEALPLDDGELMEKSEPIIKDGKLNLDNYNRFREAREDAEVKAALASGPVSFIILGGEIDLSESVRRLGNGTTEYIRVTTSRYQETARIK